MKSESIETECVMCLDSILTVDWGQPYMHYVDEPERDGPLCQSCFKYAMAKKDMRVDLDPTRSTLMRRVAAGLLNQEGPGK